MSTRSAPTGALPLDPYDGAAPVAPPGGPTLVDDSLFWVVLRVGAPAVASNLLMILFLAVDAFWVGQRLGATALAAVTTSLFWIWMFISVAEMVGVGLTAVAYGLGMYLGVSSLEESVDGFTKVAALGQARRTVAQRTAYNELITQLTAARKALPELKEMTQKNREQFQKIAQLLANLRAGVLIQRNVH